MSRYTITVTNNDRADLDAVIGYDPPLRTFFLQAFPDESGDDLALWLGTGDREYETVDALHAAALSRGYDFMPLPRTSPPSLLPISPMRPTARCMTARSPRCGAICNRGSPHKKPAPEEPARAFFVLA